MYVPEVAPHFSSAGGFSNFYPVPSYQTDAVKNYLDNHVPDYPYYIANASGTNYGENKGIYNRAGRGIPDVSANGAYLNAFVAGKLGNWFVLALVILSLSQTRFNSILLIGSEPHLHLQSSLRSSLW